MLGHREIVAMLNRRSLTGSSLSPSQGPDEEADDTTRQHSAASDFRAVTRSRPANWFVVCISGRLRILRTAVPRDRGDGSKHQRRWIHHGSFCKVGPDRSVQRRR